MASIPHLFRCASVGIFALCAISMSTMPTLAKQDSEPCPFNAKDLSFEGTPIEQARCLLRQVEQGAHLNPPQVKSLPKLAAPFERIIGQPVGFTKEAFRAYLKSKGASEQDLGGSLDKPITRAGSNSPDQPFARYFVIHDTSTPNCSDPRAKKPSCDQIGKHPKNMDKESWPFNGKRLVHRYENGEPIAHVFVSRTGRSATALDFSTPWKAVKFERTIPGGVARGLFLHVENVQPRTGIPAIQKPNPKNQYNDSVAPKPGFAPAQYERLALVYVAASLRRGEWLVPAFHAAVDAGISDGHDDPQNFSLAEWGAEIQKVIDAVKKAS